jgi:probable DNA repair protein
MNGTDLPVELPRPIADALDRGATVVTVNQRSARNIRLAYDRCKRGLGLISWQPADVLAWDSWTAFLWRSLLLEGQVSELLLNRTQEHTIWRRVISTDPEMQNTLRSPDSLAELAADAWKLLARHNGLLRLRGNWANPETRTFQRWVMEFERRCRAEKLLPQASLESALSHALERSHLRIAGAIALFGFEEMTPAQRKLIEDAVLSGTTVEELTLAVESTDRLLVRAEDEDHELEIAARWARNLLHERPSTRIAIILPSLEDRRTSIDRVFRAVLAPELEDIAAANHTAPYEFSLGSPLAETPMVRVALDLLRWVSGPLAIDRISALLVSPLFAADEDERHARATFDAFELRQAKILRPEASLNWLADMIARSRRRPQLTTLLSVLKTTARITEGISAGERRSYGAWADAIRELLQAMRWGRGPHEDSIEFQTRRKWESALDELATLDFEGERLDLVQARTELERITRLTTFAPESRDTPIQILGPLEAAGSNFDAVWFIGAANLTWPPNISTNPLLPWALQRELGAPGTDNSSDDMRAGRIVQRIAASAPVSIFSYATESRDGVQRPSPVLDVLHLRESSVAAVAPPLETFPVVPLEEFTDAAPLSPLPDRIIRGGAEILHLQAACGFRAFAEHRLWSNDLEQLELGMDAGERGNVVHRALEHFWREEATSQTVLKAMTSEQRKAALDRSIEYGLRRVSKLLTGWDEAYLEMQRTRLAVLLDAWLQIELKREPFSVKLNEQRFDDAHIGPLRLSVRLDRVDESETGDVIIDYKTGTAAPSEWQGNRPDAPQLPLYAVLAVDAQPESQLADVAFGLLRPAKEMAFDSFTKKITAETSKSQRRPRSLPEQIDTWRDVLTELAQAFYRGDTRVDPKKYPTTCSRCEQRILCRLNPAAFDEDLDEEETPDTGNG